MYKERLRTLSTYLRALPAEQYNHEVWACGTTACALGHACSIPEFQTLGLSLATMDMDVTERAPTYRPPMGVEVAGLSAGIAFFGLTGLEAKYIFGVNAYVCDGPDVVVTPTMVADRIDNLISPPK